MASVLPRKTAAVRREEVLQAALKEFARGGLHGTSTEAIAARAGISQPYLFRLFGTKRDLFIATAERCFDLTMAHARAALEAAGNADPLEAIERGYVELLGDPKFPLGQLHAYAACSDDAVRAVIRRRWSELWAEMGRLTGAPPDAVAALAAKGLLLTVAAALEMPELADSAWWADPV